MIDIGFSKIALISVVALVVLGPERLPMVARTVGNLFGRAQRYMNEVKQEVSRQMEQEELKKMKQEATDAFNAAKSDFQGLNEAVSSQISEVNQSIGNFSNDLNQSLNDQTTDYSAESIGVDTSTSRYTQYKSNRRQGRNSWRNKKGAIPIWFKQSTGIKTRVQSGSARVKRFRRAASQQRPSSSFF
ncbi:Sec-independent protein translocase protein TatB [Polynucleobacter kasalickyi]|uniref:Sec-independent protein translocase protein TatB n=1 Tax=Polynucleobacter kasalickyi TaxID=1938817 RepID=A0A1W2BYN4_9BURK|nr:Sec-independent protein translocase protein TatB [Polynucleobacter kasalickyi]SMC78095.1 sec-independent protein translocase protein TatB [Polynucleobacter kasalickyi]